MPELREPSKVAASHRLLYTDNESTTRFDALNARSIFNRMHFRAKFILFSTKNFSGAIRFCISVRQSSICVAVARNVRMQRARHFARTKSQVYWQCFDTDETNKFVSFSGKCVLVVPARDLFSRLMRTEPQ